MRKLRIFEHISLDGVIQQSADENNFPYSNWSAPYRTPAGRDLLVTMYGEKYDLLLGRRTYDGLSNFWPKQPSSPMADRLNAAKKYVVTHRSEGLTWGPFEAVQPDAGQNLVESIRRIKSQDGSDFILFGSSTLTSALLEHGLADEIVLLVDPILLGVGKRIFADGTPARAFDLTGSQRMSTGIVINTFKPAGPLKSQQ
jgi:dihydrofolate reductase